LNAILAQKEQCVFALSVDVPDESDTDGTGTIPISRKTLADVTRKSISPLSLREAAHPI
jgi:hypothetical protein